MSKKNSFIFYNEYLMDLAYLDAEDFKTIMFWLSDYQATGKIPDEEEREENPTLFCLFAVLRRRIDYDDEKYQERIDRNQNNGKKGGRPKTQNNPEKPNHNPDEPRKSLMDMDMVMDMDTSTNVDVVVDRPQPHPLPILPETFDSQEIVDAWNACEVTQPIQQIRPLSARDNNTRLSIGTDRKLYLDTIRSLDNQAWFVSEKARGKPLKYDWFCQPDNYQKVLEGNYRNSFEKESRFESYELKRDW